MFASVIRTVSGKRAAARNLKCIQEALAPHQEELELIMERHFTAERAANPAAKELSLERQAEMLKTVREINGRSVDIKLGKLSEDDIDLDKFEGEEALGALAVLDGVVIQ
jgi:hypothetical protein